MNRKIGNLHLQKLSRRHRLRTSILLSNYAIKSLFKSRHAIDSCFHYLSLENIISKQWLLIKSSIVDTNNHLNGIFPLFNSLNSKFSPGSRLIDIFSSHFSFHQADYKNKESKAAQIPQFTLINNNLLLYWRILDFFSKKHSSNLVEFWDCPSDTKELSVYSRERTLYRVYTRELNRELCTGFVYDMKKFNLIPLSPSKV